MSFFNKVFASVGIGAATVDTKLEKDTVAPGEEVRGVVEIRGGSVEQKVDQIYLSLYTEYLKESDDSEIRVSGLIDKFRLTDSFTIEPNGKKDIPFSIQLPFDTPVSYKKTKVWVATGLDIKNAVDPTDKDYLKVQPNPIMESVFSAMADLGFKLFNADCEQASYHLRGRLPFVQEFEFIPVSGPYRGRLDEVEFVFLPRNEDHYEVLMQVDRKARGLGGFLSSALDMDETNVRVSLTTSDIPTVKQKIQSVIDKYS